VETTTPGIKVNLFEVPGGYVLPVTFGGDAKQAVVTLRNIAGLENVRAEALLPGSSNGVPVQAKLKEGALELQVPLERGCAMVKLTK
jgi:hypothetical protein